MTPDRLLADDFSSPPLLPALPHAAREPPSRHCCRGKPAAAAIGNHRSHLSSRFYLSGSRVLHVAVLRLAEGLRPAPPRWRRHAACHPAALAEACRTAVLRLAEACRPVPPVLVAVMFGGTALHLALAGRLSPCIHGRHAVRMSLLPW